MAQHPPTDLRNSREVYLRLLTFVRPYWKAFAVSIVCMGLSSIVEPAFPMLMKQLLDNGFSSTPGNSDWLIYPLAIFGIFLMRAVVGFVADYSMSWVAQNAILNMREQMFDNLLRLPVQYYSDNSSGRLLTRVANDVNGVATAATSVLTTLVKDSLSIVGLLLWLLYLNWKLTLITFAMVPLIVLIVKMFSVRVRMLSRNAQETQGTLVQTLQESIEGHKVVKIFGGQQYEKQRFMDVAKSIRGIFIRAASASALQGPIIQFIAAGALAIIMGIVLKQAADGHATVGDFVSFITAMMMILPPTRRLTDINAAIQRGLIAAESVFHLIDLSAEPDSGMRNVERLKGDIAFDQVSFTYSGGSKAALEMFNLNVRSGERIALVGRSGSGKTSVTNLLARFYEATTGEIRIDGIPLKDMSLKTLRQNIALVSQEVVLFNGTIAENIAYGSSRDVSQDEIRSAAIAAHALEFIERLPAGFGAIIGERGVKLSGGQRQRLAIARALLKNAPILILDEATSALDTESERQVQAALDELMVGRTTLVVAHRLSTIENVDRIVVMSNGRIVEIGSHADLLKSNGAYSRLYAMQQLSEARY